MRYRTFVITALAAVLLLGACKKDPPPPPEPPAGPTASELEAQRLADSVAAAEAEELSYADPLMAVVYTSHRTGPLPCFARLVAEAGVEGLFCAGFPLYCVGLRNRAWSL